MGPDRLLKSWSPRIPSGRPSPARFRVYKSISSRKNWTRSHESFSRRQTSTILISILTLQCFVLASMVDHHGGEKNLSSRAEKLQGSSFWSLFRSTRIQRFSQICTHLSDPLYSVM